MKKKLSWLLSLLFIIFGSTSVSADKLIYSEESPYWNYETYADYGVEILNSMGVESSSMSIYPISYMENEKYSFRPQNIPSPDTRYNYLLNGLDSNRKIFYDVDTGGFYSFPKGSQRGDMVIGFQGCHEFTNEDDYVINRSTIFNGGKQSASGVAFSISGYADKKYKVKIYAKNIGDETGYLSANFEQPYINEFGGWGYDLENLTKYEKVFKPSKESNAYEFVLAPEKWAEYFSITTGSTEPLGRAQFKIHNFEIYEIADETKVSEISITPEAYTIKVGKTKLLYTKIKPDTAVNKKVTYKSSDSSIAIVYSNGKVKGVKPGIATITATTEDGGYTAQSIITVN